MSYPYYIVDAFAEEVFKGNPAAVYVLEKWLPEAVMQNIAIENNLSETAFTVKETKLRPALVYAGTRNRSLWTCYISDGFCVI